jgi:GxxExxY protein
VVVVELKVAPEITNRHRAQTLSYIRVTGADVGLLAAFGGRVRIERYANFFAHKRPAFAWEGRVPDDKTLLYPELVGQIYECLYRVHYELGPGFLHPVYRNAARLELNAQQIGCVYLRELPVTYEGQTISSRRCFLLVLEDKILLTAFAARDYTPARQEAFATQMRRYLRYLDKELGLLANFYRERLVVTPVRLGKKA